MAINSLPLREQWRLAAVCAQADPEVFFPEVGTPGKAAKLVCLSCPVREQCLQWALDHGEWYGIWGGTTAVERRQVKRQRRQKKKHTGFLCGKPASPGGTAPLCKKHWGR